MIVEIPKGEQPKLEIDTKNHMNPIKQDVKNGKLRVVALPYPFNYGAFPQTWENPMTHDPRTNAKGDKDPLDVCDISAGVSPTGTVKAVKVLGVWAMIDAGETDWKVLVIDVNDPDAARYNDISDVPPAKIEEAFTFLRDYKIPDGNPPNQFAFEGQLQTRQFALGVVEEQHEEWRGLQDGRIAREGPGYSISLANTTLPANQLSPADALTKAAL